VSESAAISDAAAGAGELRVAVNRQISRGMLLTTGTTALAMDRLGVPRSIIWSFAGSARASETSRGKAIVSEPRRTQ
jgi:hypothetical protein